VSDTWTVTAEGSASAVYEMLKEEFDSKQVPKEHVRFETSSPLGGTRAHKKEQHKQLTGADRRTQDNKSLQFRSALKAIQSQLSDNPSPALFTGKVKATIRGDAKSLTVKLEEVS
jgi:hypothetical protein